MSVAVPGRDADVLDAVRAVLGPPSVHTARVALRPVISPPAEPPSMGPTAMGLLQHTLRKGAVRALVVHGGWRVRPRIRDETVVRGRLWEVSPQLELRFSTASYRLCQFLRGASALTEPQTLGDELLYLLTADTLHRGGHSAAALSNSALVQLAFPETCALDFAPRWNTILSPEGLRIIEGIEDLLATRWAAMELGKAEPTTSAAVQQLSEHQRHVLTSFLDAVDREGCPQAATFLVDAAARFAARSPQQWLEGPPSTESLRDRTAAAAATAAMLGVYRRLHTTFDDLASVPFFEPNYDRAQAVLERWSLLGRSGFASLQHIADVLSSGQMHR